jgi:transcription termination factor Rho
LSNNARNSNQNQDKISIKSNFKVKTGPKISIETKTATEYPNKFQEKKPNPRDSDFEFDGIIESEGRVLMMPDGYGFFTFLVIIISLTRRHIFIYIASKTGWTENQVIP